MPSFASLFIESNTIIIYRFQDKSGKRQSPAFLPVATPLPKCSSLAI